MSDTTRDLPSPPLPLTTRRLTIREYTDEDWPAVYAYVKDDSFWKHQAGGPPIEERVKALKESASKPTKTSTARQDSDETLSRLLDLPVMLKSNAKGGGMLQIKYKNQKELEALRKKLLGEN